MALVRLSTAYLVLHRTVFLNTRAGEDQALTFELGIQSDGTLVSLVSDAMHEYLGWVGSVLIVRRCLMCSGD